MNRLAIRLLAALLALSWTLPAASQEEEEPKVQAKVATGEEAIPAPKSSKGTEAKEKAQEAAPRKNKKKKKSSGYDYENSRYLAPSQEANVYRFNERGEPVVPEAKKKRRVKADGAAKDTNLGAHRPKRALKKVTLGGEEEADGRPGADPDHPAAQPPPGMLPPGMNPGGANVTP